MALFEITQRNPPRPNRSLLLPATPADAELLNLLNFSAPSLPGFRLMNLAESTANPTHKIVTAVKF